jgi:hypothetical protein
MILVVIRVIQVMPFTKPFRQKDEKPGREGEWKELRFPEVSNDTPLVEGTPLVKDMPLVKERQTTFGGK